MTNIDDVAQTLAEYERLAIATSDTVKIDPPEFSDGTTPLVGSSWSPFWMREEPPAVARATAYRNGVATVVYVSWAESFPAEESWRALWLAKPMKLFGAYAVRAALRRAFRDAIGDRREPDETTTDPAAPARDWEAEVDAAPTADAVHALHAEMKRARAVTPQLEAQLRNRLKAAAWAPAEEPEADVNDPREVAAVAVAEVQRPRTQDHLPPTNRAARRAKAKGRRK